MSSSRGSPRPRDLIQQFLSCRKIIYHGAIRVWFFPWDFLVVTLRVEAFASFWTELNRTPQVEEAPLSFLLMLHIERASIKVKDKVTWRRKWQPTPVFLPGESHGQRSLVGYSPWGRKELDMTECACKVASLSNPPLQMEWAPGFSDNKDRVQTVLTVICLAFLPGSIPASSGGSEKSAEHHRSFPGSWGAPATWSVHVRPHMCAGGAGPDLHAGPSLHTRSRVQPGYRAFI